MRKGLTYFLLAMIFPLARPGAAGAEWKMIPQLRSGSVAATANQNFGAGPGRSQTSTFPPFASLPQTLQAAASDQHGKERSAQSEIRLDVENGALRFDGRLAATDADPNDFLAPLASVKGAVSLDLKALGSGDAKPAEVKARFRLVGEGPPALVGAEGKPLPDNITVQVRLNDELILKSEDLLSGVEKEVPLVLHSGDVVSLFFQVDFSFLSAEQARVASAFRYSFLP